MDTEYNEREQILLEIPYGTVCIVTFAIPVCFLGVTLRDTRDPHRCNVGFSSPLWDCVLLGHAGSC